MRARGAMAAAAAVVAASALAGVAGASEPAGADDVDTASVDPTPVGIAAATTPGRGDPQCMGDRYVARSTDAADAAALMDGRLTLTAFSSWKLPTNPNWRENPFANDVWAFDYQTLRWADVLRREGLRTGNQKMLDRYGYLWSDWIGNNGYTAERRSPFTWHPMVVGVRSIGLVCAADALDGRSWLREAMQVHAAALQDPDERAKGNHALHQDMGLLALGCHTGRDSWRDLAVDRSTAAIPKLINSEGVAREGAMQYQALDHRWYLTLQTRLLACGLLPDPSVFTRVALMPDFIGYGTQPDGYLIPWGDTSMQKAVSVPGTVTEYALSKGLKGLLPPATFALFPESGYAFSRSAWFDRESAEEQSLASVRFGPSMASQPHAHEDAGAVSFYAAGKQILWQPGLYAYGEGIRRTYVRSNEAHNVVDIAGATYDRTAESDLTHSKSTAAYDLVRVRTQALSGADWKRTVVHFKDQNLLLVDDQVNQTKNRTVTQNWHLGADRSVSTGDMKAWTSGSGSDATILWAGTDPTLKVSKGKTNPMLGWRSEKTNSLKPTPTLQAGATGKTVRLTAIVVPKPNGEKVSMLRWATSGDNRTVDIAVGAKKFRIVFSHATASIKEL
ncbi:MAG: heparinase II/III domain-containing protein [Sporichthyaceae bacterium]